MIRHKIAPLVFACAMLIPAANVFGQSQAQENTQGREDVPFAFGERDRALMRARLLDHNGEQEEALDIYKLLLVDIQGDPQILTPYVDLLSRLERYDEARAILADWLEQDPDSVDALMRLGYVQAATNDPDAAAKTYENALALAKAESSAGQSNEALQGLAYALLESNQRAEALRRFEELAELQPENQEVTIAIRELRRELSTRYMVSYDHQFEDYGGNLGRLQQDFRHWFTDDTRAELSYSIVTVNRSQSSDARALKHTLSDARLNAYHFITPRLELMAGIGSHWGTADGMSQAVGVHWEPFPDALFSLDVERRVPWYETLEANAFRGEQDRGVFLARYPFYEIFALEGELAGERYYLEGDHYATRLRGRISGSVRLLEIPYVTIGYSYMRAHVDYADSGLNEDGEYLFRPVDLVEDEDGHTLELYIDHRFTPRLRASLFAGWTIDTARDANPLTIAPTVEFWLADWAVLQGRFSYSSDNTEAGGGESLSVGTSLEIMF